MRKTKGRYPIRKGSGDLKKDKSVWDSRDSYIIGNPIKIKNTLDKKPHSRQEMMKGSYNLNTLPVRQGVDGKKMSIPEPHN